MGSLTTLHACVSASFWLKSSVRRKFLSFSHQALTQIFLHLWRDPACHTAWLPHSIFVEKNPPKPQPLPLRFFLAILSLVSQCALLCRKFTRQFSFSFPGWFFYFFLVPQIYFSCLKSARKYLQVSNCPHCLSAIISLFPLSKLQHRSQLLL